MSKQKIIDIITVLLLVIFMAAIFLVPSLKDYFLQILCIPEVVLMKNAACTFGYFLLYLIPFVSVSWLIVRVFVKITKFASIVDLNSGLCKEIGVIYQKIKVLDG